MMLFLFLYFISQAADTPESPAPAPVAEAPAPAAPNAVPVPAGTDSASTASTLSSAADGESLVLKLTQPFIYEDGLRDPFVPPEGKAIPLVPKDLFGPLLEMQEVPLESVTVKGIFLDPVNPKALISYKNPHPSSGQPTEFLKKISIKDYLGENFGVVSSIRDGQVIIVQTLEEGDKKSTTTRTLTIRK